MAELHRNAFTDHVKKLEVHRVTILIILHSLSLCGLMDKRTFYQVRASIYLHKRLVRMTKSHVFRCFQIDSRNEDQPGDQPRAENSRKIERFPMVENCGNRRSSKQHRVTLRRNCTRMAIVPRPRRNC